MRNLDELGLYPRRGGAWPKPPTDLDFTRFEEHFNVRLPAAYRRFLSLTNGGSAKKRTFSPGGRAEPVCLDIIFCLCPGPGHVEGLWDEMESSRNYLPPQVVPIADDGLGNKVLLDLRDAPPSIRFWSHEGSGALELLATSFEDFINDLTEPDLSWLETR